MTLSSTTSRAAYAGNGSTTEFAVPFLFADNTHIVATLRDADGAETPWSENTHYTLTGAGEAGGGTLAVITAPADHTPQSGETLVIRRIVPLTQETDYVENDPFPAEAHEQALDLAAMRDQQLQEQLDRTLRFPITDTSPLPELPSFASRANKLLGFDAQGDPTLFADSGDADAVTALGTTTPRTLAERFGDFRSVKDFGAAGDGVADDTAAIRAAFAAGPQVYFPPGIYRITDEIDLRGKAGLWILGTGFAASPAAPGGFQGSAPATILQAANDKRILRISGSGHRIDGLALIYQSQQTAEQTAAVALELNNVSASDIRNLRIMQANTSIGVPQAAYGPEGFNAVWNTVFENIDSNSASDCHYDLRNFDGGGTNVKLSKLYANGGGALDFSSLGQQCRYVIRGRNWSGYEVDALSIDALTFTEHLIEIENANPVSFDTLRFESVNCRKDNEGWIKFTGGYGMARIGALHLYRCRALVADVPNATYLVRSSATRFTFDLAHIFLKDNCDFTVSIARPLSVGVVDATSEFRIGRIDNECANFTSTTWTENSVAFPFSTVRWWDGKLVTDNRKSGTSTVTHRVLVGVAPPTIGAWAHGDQMIAANPGDMGRVWGWICAVAGSPGTWVPMGLSGIDAIQTQAGDADVTLSPNISRPVQRFVAMLAADRVVTLSSVGAWNGCTFRISRVGAGSFHLDVGPGPLKSLAANEWCDVTYDGGAWRLVAYGSL